MRFGLSEQELEYLMQSVVLPLKQQHTAQVYIFGSRARGSHQRFSDIDLLVDSPSDLAKEIGEIAEALEASNFPYKVDLVENRHLAEAYRTSVERDKIAL